MKMKLILSAIVLSQIFAVTLGQTGLFSVLNRQNSASAPRNIINGTQVKVNELKYQVFFHGTTPDKKDWISTCGGGIISKQHILTAAHCVLDENDQFLGPVPVIIPGVVNVLAAGVKSYQVEVTKAYVPKTYDGHETDDVYTPGDIAVLKLKNELDLGSNSTLAKLNLPPAGMVNTYDRIEALVAGFDIDQLPEDYNETRNATAGWPNGELNKIRVLILDFASDKAPSVEEECQPYEEYICATTVGNNFGGACEGDSGGPLVYDNTVIGVASTGHESCDQNWEPEVYTRVSTYVDFINDAMNDKVTSDMRAHVW